MNKRVVLMILDGWGISPNSNVSAIEKANTPFTDKLYGQYPHATLRTDGMEVGLPDGQMGNSEVGHVNLGAGRIVYQDLAKINMAVEENSLKDEVVLQEAFKYAKENNKSLHFLGLVSDGGVHAHINHIEGLLQAAKQAEVPNTLVHAFTDGRDVDPKSGLGFLTRLEKSCAENNAKIASIIGRYYAMDRDKRWERVKKAYDLLIHGTGIQFDNIQAAIEKSYANNITDEFIEPICVTDSNGQPNSRILPGDVVVFFNFRTDRGRQLTQVLNQVDMPEYDMKKLDLHYVTMTNYDESFNGVQVVFDKENVVLPLGEVLAQNGKTQIRIAETEKYPHVTFFFNGGREEPFEGEERILCPSPKVATYDLKPEMSAYEIRDAIVPKLKSKAVDFVCLNFANPDMVGHTGSMEAAIKACETVDVCAKDVVEAAQEGDYSVIIIADHGNCDTMINPDGTPNTAHTTNPVPIILVDNDIKSLKSGNLSNLAPTILKMIGVAQPEVMTSESLI
ncbi:MAG: 2,3-bisphosphoglycerate-independent phosphoglycerate mutase [Flavobacteriaceae bacterium]|nr:2,3-bisphosphoglycerate-independent phosphoglycerate mutase [Flavobacteriaceae bacterium]